LVFAALPSISVYDFEVQALRGCCGLGSNFQTVTDMAETVSFLMSPCLFFVALYIYGKRAMRHFSRSHVGVALSLLIGSCIGFAIYILSTPIVDGIPVSLSIFYSYSFVYGIVSSGVRNALIGIAALALSCLGVKSSAALPEEPSVSTIV
jgi:hypothetical protein